MKKILSNFINSDFFVNICIAFMLIGVFFTPLVVLNILGLVRLLDLSSAVIIYIAWIAVILEIYEKYSGEFIIFFLVVGIIYCTFFFWSIYIESSQKKSVSNTTSASYQVRREHSPNYSYYGTNSNSNYSHSEPQYTSPEKIVSYSPYVKTEEIVDTEPLITSKDNQEHNNRSFTESSEVALSDTWEYVTSDEQGNEYYINKTFGAHSIATSIEGNVFYASFKQVLKDSGIEFEASVYDTNRGKMTERKILAYLESIIRFRNRNGVKEFSFYSLYGYTADKFIVTGWKKTNIDSIYEWQPINDEVYDSLYNAAYKNL